MLRLPWPVCVRGEGRSPGSFGLGFSWVGQWKARGGARIKDIGKGMVEIRIMSL